MVVAAALELSPLSRDQRAGVVQRAELATLLSADGLSQSDATEFYPTHR